MKKFKSWIVILAGLLLLASCNSKNNEGPLEMPKSPYTPTPIEVPTCTPSAEPTEAAVMDSTATLIPTEMPVPTKVEPSPILTTVITPTATPEPTATLVPTATPVPTEAEPSPTPSPEPTPTVAVTPTATPEPTATPTPAVSPELLVLNGWQKSLSFDEKYTIIFPDVFCNSTLVKTEKSLEIGYTSPKDKEIGFTVNYTMNCTLEEAVEAWLTTGSLIEINQAEQKISYLFYKDGKMHQGVLMEEQYAKDLLGLSFGEGEFVTGVMNIFFSYPEERSKEYQTEKYNYYVINNREEK